MPSNNAPSSKPVGRIYRGASIRGTIDLADIIHKHIIKATGFKDRSVNREGFFVLKATTMPAVVSIISEASWKRI